MSSCISKARHILVTYCDISASNYTCKLFYSPEDRKWLYKILRLETPLIVSWSPKQCALWHLAILRRSIGLTTTQCLRKRKAQTEVLKLRQSDTKLQTSSFLIKKLCVIV